MQLAGKLLVAMPSMSDPRFHRSVILMCAHDPDSALGLIVNKPAPDQTVEDLLEQIDLRGIPDGGRALPVHFGGPVERQRGFVLHSTDYLGDEDTLRVNGGFCMTASKRILDDIGNGTGPVKAMLALGYAGWGPGQLESEIVQNGWLVVDADHDVVFDCDNDEKWARALDKVGIDPRLLSGDFGHA